jgi:hypothetical protein
VGGEEGGCVAEVACDSTCQSRATHEQGGAGEQPVQAPPAVLGHGGPVDEGDVGRGHQPAGPGLEQQPRRVDQGERRGHLGQEQQGPGAVTVESDGGDGRVELAGGDPHLSQHHEDQIDPVNKDTKRVAEKTMELKINLVKVMKDISKNTKLVPIIRGVVGLNKKFESAKLCDQYCGLLISNFECPEKVISCLDFAAGDQLFYHLIESTEVEEKIEDLEEFEALNFIIKGKNDAELDYDFSDPKFQDSFPLLDVLDYHPDLESVMISVFGTTLICRNSHVAEILGAETEFRCTTLDMKAPEHVRLYMRYLSLKKEIKEIEN